jgi:hypothetical protein
MCSNDFIFIIDTNQFAIFDGDMTAYLTGHDPMFYYFKDPNFISNKYTKMFLEKYGGDRPLVKKLATPRTVEGIDKEIYSPSSMHSTPGYFNNGHGGNFRNGEDEAAEKQRRESVQQLAAENPGSFGRVLLEALDKPMEHYPAYLSAAIHFKEEPTKEDIAFMKERAYEFAKIYKHEPTDDVKITITGFRLIKPSVELKV